MIAVPMAHPAHPVDRLAILVADDHAAVRTGLKNLIASRPGWFICGEAATGDQAVALAIQLRPAVTVMDISMPIMDGLEATRRIRQQLPEAEVVIVSQHDSDHVIFEAQRAGARSFVVKSQLSADLLPALEAALAHRSRVSARVARAWQSAISGPPQRTIFTSDSLRSDPPRGNSDEASLNRPLRLDAGSERDPFRSMIDVLSMPIYCTDADGRLTYYNRAAVELSGRTPELGTDRWCVTWKLFRPDGTPLPHDQCPMARTLQQGRPVIGEEIIAERPDGTRRWVAPYPSPLHNAQGNLVGGINLLLDITDQKLSQETSSLLAAIVDSSDDAIVSKNLDGIITSWNRGAQRIFGYTAAEAIGQHITLIIPDDRRAEEADILARLRRGERVDHIHTIRHRKDGALLDISLSISPVIDSSGRIVGASKVARDITAQKRVEEDYRQLAERLEAEVHARTRELEERNAEVLRQSEQLRQLSWYLLRAQDQERRRIARELHDSAGQTLTVLGINIAQLVHKAGRSAPELASDAEQIQEVVQQLHREIRTASYLLHPPLLDETGLSSALDWYVEGLIDRSSIDVHLDIQEDFGRLPADMELMVFRLVQECLTNIHRHSGSKTAFIRIAREGDQVTVLVEDHGKGMSPERLAEIQAGRSGVGIRGMRERVRQFEGSLNIESTTSGTRVFVTIPIPDSETPKQNGVKPLQAAV